MRPQRIWLLVFYLGWLTAPNACPEPVVDLKIAYPAPPYTEFSTLLTHFLETRGIPVAQSPCPRFHLALGTKAVTTIRQRDKNTPIVAALVLERKTLLEAAPATGVWLRHPLETQWRHLRRMVPMLRHLTVLYDPTFATDLHRLEQMARRDGIGLMAIPIHAPSGLGNIPARIPMNTDAVFPLGDSRMFPLTGIQPLVLATYPRGIVLVGLSARWVAAGATYALDWDWPQLARQAGELAAALWHGAPLADLPPQPPAAARLIVNTALWPSLAKR